jgi:hypothetical protein
VNPEEEVEPPELYPDWALEGLDELPPELYPDPAEEEPPEKPDPPELA